MPRRPFCGISRIDHPLHDDLTPVKFPDISGIKPVDTLRINKASGHFAIMLENPDCRRDGKGQPSWTIDAEVRDAILTGVGVTHLMCVVVCIQRDT